MKCTATRSDGEHCKAWAIKGASVCRVHGGSAPQVKAAAAVRVVEQKAVAVIRKHFDARTPVTDPLAAIAEVAGEMVAVKDWLRQRVEAIQAQQMRVETFGQQAEQMRAEFQAYVGMLASCSKVIGDIARLNIEERMARVTELQAAAIISALDRTLAELGISGEQATKAKASIGRHLRVVPAIERRSA